MAISTNKEQLEQDSFLESSATASQPARAVCNPDGSNIGGATRASKSSQQTQIASSTSETTIATAVAATYLDLYGLTISNTSATTTDVIIKDATAGTTRFVIEVPANDTRGFMLPASDGVSQAVLNNNWTATCADSVANIEITALFTKNT